MSYDFEKQYKTFKRQNYIVLKLVYKINGNDLNKNNRNHFKINKKTRIFGKNFVNKNYGKFKIIYMNKGFNLKEYFEDVEKNYINKNIIKLKLMLFNNIVDINYIFEGCYSLISISDNSKENTNKIIIDSNKMKLFEYYSLLNKLESKKIIDIFQIISSLSSLLSIKEINSSYMSYEYNELLSLDDVSKCNNSSIDITEKNVIKGIIEINSDEINKNIVLFNNEIKCEFDIYINENKINIIEDNNRWNYNFKKEGKYNFEIIFTGNINNLSGFFNESSMIISLDFINFNTSNVVDMSYMFNKCHKLKGIKGINNFNTINVNNMGGMFQQCNELEYIDLSNFNTSNVTDMGMMFRSCKKLKDIKGLNKFNTTKVTTMDIMFNGCNELEYLDLSNFNVSNVINLSFMFNLCYNLKEIKGINNFNTNKVKNMNSLFRFCEKLEYLNLSNFNTSKVTIMINMFSNCKSLKKIKGLVKFNTAKITKMSSLFYRCYNLENLDLSNFNTKNVIDMASMFCSCNKLKKIKGINNFNTDKVTNMNSMFSYCYQLEFLDLSNFNTSSVTDMSFMFQSCYSLKKIKGLTNFNTIKVINMNSMFQLCMELEYLDLSNFNTSNVTNMSFMFNQCFKLKKIKGIDKFNTKKVINLNLSNFNYLNNDNIPISKSRIENQILSKKENLDLEIIYKLEKNIKDIMNSNENKLRILGNKFLLNNKDKCKIIYKEQKYEPKEYFEEIDNNYSKTDFIQIKLRINNDIEDMSHMFENCNQLISISESIEMNNKNINYDFINDNYY